MEDRIQVFARHCYFSKAGAHKKRLPGFDREKCFQNLVKTSSPETIDLRILFDHSLGPLKNHFLKEVKSYPIIEFRGGTESASFLFLLDYVRNLSFKDDTILYFVEDDYLHREGWPDLLQEAFQIPGVDYVTLYDHKDKYLHYPKLRSEIFVTSSSHWRTTPSTTQTFAVKFSTLKKDWKVHEKYSKKGAITKDHEKFLDLGKKGRKLISSVPGFSTHVDDFLSPITDWQKFFKLEEYDEKYSNFI